MAKDAKKEELSNEFCTVPEACELLGIQPATLRKYLRAKKIRAFKKFKRWYVFKSDIVEFIKSQNS